MKKVKEKETNDEIKVRICNVLSIKDKPWYSIFKDLKFWIPTFISIIAVLISSIPYLQQIKIDGRITGLLRTGYMNYSYIDTSGILINIEGVGYTINVIIAVRNKNFILKDFDVFIKFFGDDQKYKGEVIPANEII